MVTDQAGKELDARGERIGPATSNVAEYRALLLGIERGKALGASEVQIRCDSELVVRQVRGDYKVKNSALRDLHKEVLGQLEHFDDWSIEHVRREQNEEADSLVNETLDA